MGKIKISEKLQLGFQTKEAFKSLRTNIQFCGSDIKVIGVTSCTPGEGKSSVSMHLAHTLAESGKKVIFIDADLRKSVIMGRYQVEGKIFGLTIYLSGMVDQKDIINKTDVENLDMVFAGPVPPNPSELLGSSKFEELIEKLRNDYDYVIIDTPPVGSVIDGAVVAKSCDGMVMIVQQKVISYRFAQHMKKQLQRSNCKILGVVLNKVEFNGSSPYGKYYGKYYSKYYENEVK